MSSELIRLVGNMSWAEVTTVQQLCNLRKQQLRALEPFVYVLRRGKEYLAYRRGVDEVWSDLRDLDLAVYPSFEVADYVRGQMPGSGVIKIPKTEFVTMPACAKLLKEEMVTPEGDFNA